MDNLACVVVAAHGLAGSRTDLPTEPLSVVEWFDVVHACQAGGLVGFLADAVAAGRFPVTSGQSEELSALERDGAGLSLLVERQAVGVAGALAAAGIDHRVIDGPARRLAYGDRGVRHHRAARVLVGAADLAATARLLGARPSPAGGPVVTGRVVARSSIRGARGDAAVPQAGGAEPGDLLALLGPGAELPVAGRTVRVLSLAQQLVVACVEATVEPAAPIVDLRDIAQLALVDDLDASEARRAAAAVGAVDALARGVATAWAMFDLADKTELSAWALRRNGRRPAAAGTPAAAAYRSSSRVGLAQRVLTMTRSER
jgi:hypothetical protein